MSRCISFVFLISLVVYGSIANGASLQEAGKDSFVFAVSPMASPAATASSFSEFIDYLSEKLDKKVILKQRRKYSEVNDLLKSGKASVAFTCTGAYLAGRRDFGLELLAVPVMNGKATYNSYIIVHKDSSIKNFDELKGRTFAFTDPLSLTGRLYVTSLLNERGIMTKDYFKKTFYTAGHEKSIEAVATGLADAASVDSLILDDLARKGNSYAKNVRVIKTSQPFGIPPFVVSPALPEADRKTLIKILINMSKDTEGRKILSKIGIDGFMLPNHANYMSAHEVKIKVKE
ncbi:MAG: phosphate/phosphite/phosphonate ABC transporter substrate-binding protein [Thermodesulfovibrionales bacterium]|nr:phosphate/phosphite/phosphonate ABC transporter substrate-binding protein [Thermodesulfovibrionales bacterium]